MKNIFYNYWITGSAAGVFFFIALFDLLSHETNARAQWNQSWELMSVLGKVSALLCTGLILWTIGIRLVRSKWN